MRTFALLASLALVACSKPDPMGACKKAEAAGIGTNCRPAAETQGGIWAAAVQRVELDLTHVPGEHGQFVSFEKEEHASAAINALDAVSAFGGKNHYREGKLVAQFNSGAPAADIAAVREILAGKTPSPVAAPAVAPAPAMPTAVEPPKTIKTSGEFDVHLGRAKLLSNGQVMAGVKIFSRSPKEHSFLGQLALQLSSSDGLQSSHEGKDNCSGTMAPTGQFICANTFKFPGAVPSEAMLRVELPAPAAAVWFRVAIEKP